MKQTPAATQTTIDLPRSAGVFSPVLVGRRRELAALVGGVTVSPSLIFVEGEVGVGKTRLVTELLAHPSLRPVRSIIGHCHEIGEPYPLAPVLGALSTLGSLRIDGSKLLGCLRPYLPELAGSLPPDPGALGDPRAERHRLLRALLELLEGIGPAVVVLEDAHWLDEATDELLRLLRTGWPAGLSLVITFRGEDLPETSAVRSLMSRPIPGIVTRHLALQPFTTQEVRAFVRSALDREDVSEEFADFLWGRTAGIPFALEEMLLLLRDRQDLVRRSGGWVRRKLPEVQVPRGLQEFVRERLGRLGDDGAEVVMGAAVLDPLVSEDLLRSVAGLGEKRFAAGLAGALRSALLREEAGRYRFRHSLARDAVYRTIAGPERRRLHRKAARAIEAHHPDSVAELARHFRAAGNREAWCRYAEEASDRATDGGDYAGAVRLLRDLPDEARLSGEGRVRIVLKLAHAAMVGLAHGESIPIVRDVIEDPSVPRESRGRLRHALGQLLHQAGDASGAYREWIASLAELPEDSVERVHVLSNLASPCVSEHRVEDHLRWLGEALASMPVLREPGIRARCLVDQAATLAYVGDPSAWRIIDELPWDTTDPAAGNQVLRGAFNLATALLPLGHDERAAAFVAAGERRMGESHGLRFSRFTDIFHLLLDWRAGRWRGLEDRARMICDERDELHAASIAADLVLGSLLLTRGELAAGREILSRFVDAALPAGWVSGAAAAAAELTRVDVLTGRPEAGWEWASPLLEVMARKEIWVWAAEVVPASVAALLAMDRRTRAADLVEEFAAGIEGTDAPAARAALHASRGLLCEEQRPQVAADGHRASAAEWTRIGRPYEAARALESEGRALLSPEPQEGVGGLRRALDSYGSLGASWDAARVRDLLRRHGVGIPQRRGRRGYGTELSPREREVAELLVRGWSNREIADGLFVSVKAVEKHVSSILRKLEVGSRTEVGSVLAGPG